MLFLAAPRVKIRADNWEGGNLMKRAFLTTMLLCLFVLGIHDAQAQEYVPGYYDQYWDGTQLYAQQYDPYYELHEMHYKLYLPQFNPYLLYPYAPYQPYPYPPYQIYPPCCVPGGY